MTTREKLQSMLKDRGLSDDQSKEVIDLSIPVLKEVTDDYNISYDRDADEYPSVIYNTIFMVIKPVCLSWIDSNKPQAWFRPMFA